MKVKPWPILIIAFIHIFAPFFNIFWSSRINHISAYDYMEYLYYSTNLLSTLFWFILPIIAGLSILRFRKWSYYLILAFTLSFSIILYWQFSNTPQFPIKIFMTAELINIIVFSYFLHPSVRNVYLNKNLRWWEQKPRYVIDHPVDIKWNHQNYPGTMKNISEGGCFIETSAPIKKLDRFMMSFEIFQRKFNTESQAVFAGAEGIGTFFVTIHPSQNDLSKLIDQLANQGFPLRTPRPKWNESLSDWLRELKSGQGIIPKTEEEKRKSNV